MKEIIEIRLISLFYRARRGNTTPLILVQKTSLLITTCFMKNNVTENSTEVDDISF